MRAFLFALAVFAVTAAPAAAQDRRLYNSNGSGGTTLYNSGTGARPLSLNQITQGANTSGYSYSREGTGFTPYGTTAQGSASGMYPTMAEIDAFRDRRAAEAQAMEKQALNSLQQGHNGPLSPDAPVTPIGTMVGPTGQPVAGGPAATGGPTVKKRQRYDGRDGGVKMPEKVFNSVR